MTRTLLLVTHRPLEYGGGGSTRWRFLIDELPRHGWTVEVLSARLNPTADEFSVDPVHARLAAARARTTHAIGRAIERPYRLAGVRPEAFPPSVAWTLTGRPAIRRAVRELRPDVVVATVPPPASLFACATLDLGVPLVAEFRDLWAGNPYYDAGGRLLTRIQGKALRAAQAVVAVTPEAVATLERLHPELGDRLHLLPNGFDPALLALRGEPVDARTIVHAGGLYGDRSIAGLLEALRRPGLPPLRLELIGPGTAPPAPAGVELEIVPPVAREEAIRRTAGARIALVVFTPGDDTAVPGKLYEALALGKPVLALVGPQSAMAARLRELGQDAGCARHDDPDAIAAALKRLLASPPPPVPPQRLAPWDRAVVAADYARLLAGLLGSSP